jgi:rhodanese-related sulfurtransferase
MVKHSPKFLAIVESVRSTVRECSVQDLKQKQEAGNSFHLLDVREESEFAAGHLPGAVHLGKGVIERDIESVIPDSDAEIYLYCGGGYRSALSADSLQKMGYTRVTSVDGGWRAWNESGYPTTK